MGRRPVLNRGSVFSPGALLEQLLQLPLPSRYRVAFSGGCDSTVLLHALAALRPQLPAPLDALHVDHGLQAGSGAWSRHCAAACARLAFPCTELRVDAVPEPGESPEAAARRARYAALAGQMRPGDLLLTAHHQDDQAETLLLQLLRGAGVRGLAAMPAVAPFAGGYLARPLLDWDRASLESWARDQGLMWIDDPSNGDHRFDRNYLRHELMPLLAGRWPAAPRVLARAAAHQAEACELLDELAAMDLAAARGTVSGTLSVAALRALSPARCRNALRVALRHRGLPLPGTAQLERVLNELLPTRADAEPVVAWPGAELRRYRDDLHLLAAALPAVPAASLAWDGHTPLTLPAGLGRLRAEPALGLGLDRARWQGGRVEVRFRHGGERFRPAGRRHSQALKKLFQEAGIPPWVRVRTPLVFLDGELAAVGERWVAHGLAAQPNEDGIRLRLDGFFIETQGENNDNLPGHAP